jgi:GT2 family glycosyltransferase
MELASPDQDLPVKRPGASVVISTRNRPDELRRCLEFVRKASGGDDEIVVVDNGSNDLSTVMEIARAFDAQVYQCHAPGAARARNLGVERAKHPIIAFTDDDAVVDPDWLDTLLRPLEDAGIGAVVGPVFELGSRPPRLLVRHASFDAARERVTFNRGDPDWFERIRMGAIGSGANFAVRRELFDRHGRFRECLGAGAPIAGDEIFFFLSLVVGGETVMNEPSARVFHPVLVEPRSRELRHGRVAYWLYAICQFPQLAHRAVRRLMSRQRSRPMPSSPTAVRPPSVLRALLAAPGLLFEAWRFSRWK